MEKPISVTNDFVFKYVFGSPEREDVLLSLVNAFLEAAGRAKAVSVRIQNPFSIKDSLSAKTSVLDLKAIDASGRAFGIEMQTQGDDSFAHRSLYYWSRLYSAQLAAGIDYGELKPVIEISILDFTLFPKKSEALSGWSIRDEADPSQVLNDHLLICFLELPKLGNGALPGLLELWGKFITLEGMDSQTIDALAQQVPEIATAHEAFRRFTADETLRDELEAHEKFLHDQATLIKSARREGKAEGKAEGNAEGLAKGEAKKQREIALAMLAEGIAMETISKTSGLSLEELEGLTPLPPRFVP